MTPAQLKALLDAATKRPYAYDEPDNWLGTAARIAPQGSGDPIAQISLSGWGKRQGRANGKAIVATMNAADALVALWDVVREMRDLANTTSPSIRDAQFEMIADALRRLEELP